MANLANIRPLPGLYGGGFARVVQVEALPNGTNGAVSQAAIRLERLKDPLASFSQSLAQFRQANTVSRPQPPVVDSSSLTLLQNINPEQPLVAPFPPDQQQLQQQAQQRARQQAQQDAAASATTDDPSSYAIELARVERLREEARTESQRKEEARKEALRQFEQASAPKESLAPDPLAKLRQALENFPSDLNLESLSFDDVSSTAARPNIYSATLAAQSYASTLASV